MTDAAHAVQTAKKYAGYAKEVTDKLKAWHDEAKKLEDTGETLNEFQDVMKALTWTSKLSTGLGVMSFGISAVSALLPVETTEGKIYDAVKGLQQQVKDFEGEMKNFFKEYKLKFDKDILNDLMVVIHFNNIKTAIDAVESIAAVRAHPSWDDLQDREQDLLDAKGDLRKALTAIETVLTTSEKNENILQLTFDTTYADPREVIRVATRYQNMAIAAMSAYAARRVLAARLAAEKKGEPFGEAEAAHHAASAAGHAEVATDPAGQLANIADAIKTQIQRCFDTKERNDAVKRYFKTQLLTSNRTFMVGYQTYTDSIVKKLHEQFPYLNFTAILYKGWSGGARHGFYVGGSDYGLIKKFQYGYINDDDTDLEKLRNLLIYFAPRTVKGDPPLHKLPNLPPPSPTRKKALQAISTVVNVEKHGGWFKQWKKIRISGSLDKIIKSMYPTFMGRAPKHWGGDMVWGCYTDDTWIDQTGGFKEPQEMMNEVMGVTSQNRIGLVSKSYQTSAPSGRLMGYTTDARYYQLLAIWDDAH